jgi:hypothetical protein
MILKAPFAIALSLASLHAFTTVRAVADEDRREQRGSEDRNHGRPNLAHHPAPPKFAAHPPGPHPHGPIVRPHPVRVLQPRVIQYGGRDWHHWEHPEFARPTYYWDWNVIHNVSCVAEDSYGDQYPVTEATFSGFGITNMTAIEDDTLDRCYAESGNDPSCYLVSCSHY